MAGLAAMFVTSIVAFKAISPKIGLTNHAAHAYVTTVFLLLAVTAVQNALLPLLVLAAHAWSRIPAPCKSRFPDLDIVAALALGSFGWLTQSNATGRNAISFYEITAMGMMVGLCTIALQQRRISTRMGVLSAVTLTCCDKQLALSAIMALGISLVRWTEIHGTAIAL